MSNLANTPPQFVVIMTSWKLVGQEGIGAFVNRNVKTSPRSKSNKGTDGEVAVRPKPDELYTVALPITRSFDCPEFLTTTLTIALVAPAS